MAANPLTRRLIAAGASPERAQQFTTLAAQRATRAPGVPTPVRQRAPRQTDEGSGVNPPTPEREEDIIPPGIRQGATAEIAFDPQIAALAKAKYPTVWSPPALEAPEVEDYIIGIYGEKVNQDLINKAYQDKAPEYSKLKKSFNAKYAKYGDASQIPPLEYTFNDKLYAWLENDVPLQTVIEQIAADAVSGPGSLGGLKVNEATALAESLWAEREAAKAQIATNRANYLTNNDKYFTAGLPHPSFKYGATTNYKMRTIAIDTAPDARNWLDQYNVYARQNFPGSSAAAGIGVDKLLQRAKKDNSTPFTDEVIRRQDLYKAAIVRR